MHLSIEEIQTLPFKPIVLQVPAPARRTHNRKKNIQLTV